MPDVKEVIKSLETAVKNFERYSGDEYGREYDYARVGVDVLENALALLKAQEPRVMTVEELCRARGKPAWFEARNGRLYTGWVIIYDVQTGLGITGTRVGVTEPGHVTIWPAVELYGSKWRCWTSRPDEKTREATPWDVQEQREYEAAVEMAEYCEWYEQTYDPETGAM